MASLGYLDTPIIPGTEWHVHDSGRPRPQVVTPGAGAAPPSDAVVLFDGKDLSGWESLSGGPAGWKVEKGFMEVAPGTGDIRTRRELGSMQLHLEFASPARVEGDSQGRGNSGVFLMGLYEVQVLDNYENPTYADGTVGAVYGQFPPAVNAVRKPAEWNLYDIIWEAPAFNRDKLVRPAYVTVLLNGILLHHRRELLGRTSHKEIPPYAAHPAKGPLKLQDHKNPVRFRNIWAREIDL